MAATFLVYGPALRNGFVWDDTALVLRDPLLRSWRLIPEAFQHFLFLDATPSNFYRPLQRLTFTADYALYGFSAPWGWHLTNIAIHAAAAVALYFLALKFVARSWALGLAVIWAVHPLQTSAITYVAGRADPLAALFGFAALALGLGTLADPKGAKLRGFLAALGFLGALLSKESGIAFLLIWLLMLAWKRVGWQVAARWLAVVALVLGSYAALRLSAEHTAPPPPPQTPLAVRPILAARAIAEYAGLLVLPRTLRMERDVTTTPQATSEATVRNARLREYQTLLGIVLLIGIVAWWRWAWRRERAAALCLAAFLLAYLPISNLFSLNATVAEHWLYVPGAFLLLTSALSLCSLFGVRRSTFDVAASATSEKNIEHRMALALRSALGVWVIFLGVRTWLRQADWRDQRTFLTRTIAAGGDTPRMHINLGNLEFQHGHPDLALAHYETALKRAPDQAMAWFALANVCVRTRDFPRAHAALEKAELSPLLAADCLQTRAALEHLETGRDTGHLLVQAVERAPRNWSIRKRHLAHLAETGRTFEATQELRAFLEAQPFRAESWAIFADLLAKLGQPDAAAVARAQAARRDVRLVAKPNYTVKMKPAGGSTETLSSTVARMKPSIGRPVSTSELKIPF